MLITWCIT